MADYRSSIGEEKVTENSIASSISDFGPVIERAGKIACHLEGLCDRLTGPRLQEVSSKPEAPAPTALVHALQDMRRRLVAILDHMEDSASRLSNSL